MQPLNSFTSVSHKVIRFFVRASSCCSRSYTPKTQLSSAQHPPYSTSKPWLSSTPSTVKVFLKRPTRDYDEKKLPQPFACKNLQANKINSAVSFATWHMVQCSLAPRAACVIDLGITQVTSSKPDYVISDSKIQLATDGCVTKAAKTSSMIC